MSRSEKHYRQLLQRALDAYEIDVAQHNDAQRGYRSRVFPLTLTNGQRVAIIFFKQEPQALQRIKNADSISYLLNSQGFPARTRLKPLLKFHGSTTLQYCGLYTYIEGFTIPWEAYTRDHIKAIGKSMSDMHSILDSDRTEYPSTLPRVAQSNQSLLTEMNDYFARHGVKGALSAKLGISKLSLPVERFNSILNHKIILTHQHALHMDFVRSNILFNRASDGLKFNVEGVIDFEKTAIGHPVFDIARTLAFLYVDCPKPRDKIDKYFIYSGYHKRGRNTIRHKDHRWPTIRSQLLPELINFYLIYDLYKLLRHNPYESLAHNHHYKQTYNILKTTKMLH